jgi:hypothetical protein
MDAPPRLGLLPPVDNGYMGSMADLRTDLSEKHAAAADPARLQKQEPQEWGNRLDAFIASRPKTAALSIEAMTREAIYDRE